MTLDRYSEKRQFGRTGEPPPGAEAPGRGALTFVVQMHAARRLHWDFRLEFRGALVSWAVPRGPSFNPQDKRLAVHVEDHPLDYASFEGVIGHGNYGAGQVIVWDNGIYTPDEDGKLSWEDRAEADRRMQEGLDRGKLSFTLRGRKLRGSWTLVKTSSRGPHEWLLIKHKDAHAISEGTGADDDRSVVSGLTLEQLKSGLLPDPALASGAAPLGKASRMPKTLTPMFAKTTDKPFSSPDWVFEPKLDGYRALAFLEEGKVRLLSRNGNDFARNFPMVTAELAVLPHREMIVDGEITALNADGLPDFGLLQNNSGMPKMWGGGRSNESAQIVYYAFDLLHLDGRDLRRVPLRQRKLLLGRAVIPGSHIKLVDSIDAEGEAFFQIAGQLGIEGMVAKRRDSTYQSGLRSPQWVKVKHVQSQEFVICGYTQGEGARSSSFGSLVLGYYNNGGLTYAGRAGSGFNETTLASTLAALEPMVVDKCPFPTPPPDVDLKTVRWVKPELVAQVKFAQWTDDNILRAPVFLGLREDIPPQAVIREVPTPIEETEAAPARPAPATDDIADIVERIVAMKRDGKVDVGGFPIRLTNLDKVFWPETAERKAITKRDMIMYYARVSQWLLPHLRDRPLTLTRYPNGIDGGSFYQKRWEQEPPPFVEMVRLFSREAGGDVDYLMVNNLPTLIWLAQLADLELHPWLSRTEAEPDATHLSESFTGTREELRESVLNYPDFIAFDLDPYIYSGQEKTGAEPELNRKAFSKTVEVAFELKDILDQLSLSTFLKTSGKTGLHIYVPVLRQYQYDVTRKACELIGRFLVRQKPREVTMEWSVNKRTGKIFLDHNMNVMGKNMAAIYSLRPLPGAPASVPLSWNELEDVYPPDFNIDTVPARLAKVGDLWANIYDAKHDLHRLLGDDASP